MALNNIAVPPLGELTSLKKINLSNNDITDCNSSEFAKASSLEIIDISNNQINKTSDKEIQK